MSVLRDDVGSSPHTRGAPVGDAGLQGGDGIIPAYAGSTARAGWAGVCRADHPRIRGEHRRRARRGVVALGSSPHTRGAHINLANTRNPLRIIPAYAGSTRRPASATGSSPDHPRIRGEHHVANANFDRLRIIPAYAGSTPCPNGWRRRLPDHPRIRGEHVDATFRRRWEGGSSPHTRGAPLAVLPYRLALRIIPAYAGSTLGNPCNTKDRRRDYTSFPLPVTHPSGGGGS